MPVAIVTGASAGFGRALARALGREGWELVIDGRRPEPLTDAAAELEALGAKVFAVVGDIADPVHREELVAFAEERGGIDLVVNNAGTLGPSPLPALAATPLDALEAVYRTNVVAPLGLIQRALPALRAAQGTVVTITSDAAVEAYEGWGAYGSSKAAFEQWTNVLAAEEPSLRVYRFDPGDMRTQMHQDAFPGEDISDRPEPETAVPALLRLLHEHAPSGRYRAADVLVTAS